MITFTATYHNRDNTLGLIAPEKTYPVLLGHGFEGEVFQIADNLVEKRWNRNWFGIWCDEPHDVLESIKARLSNVQRKIFELPDKIREVVTMPEFAGYEIRGDKVVTFHEYIKAEDISDEIFRAIEKFSLGSFFNDYFLSKESKYQSNAIYSQGTVYLVDVA